MLAYKLNLVLSIRKIWRRQILRSSYTAHPEAVKMAFDVFENDPKTDKNSPPLLIMHGLLGSKQNWRAVGRVLELKINRRVFIVDARNHGDSPHSNEHSSAHMAADTADFLKSRNIKRAFVMGHSMGGRAMMFFALKYPELVERGIIVDISPVSLPRDFSSIDQTFIAMENISVSPDLSLPQGRIHVRNQIKSVVEDKETVDFIMLNLKKRETGEFYWAPNIDVLHKNLRIFSEFMKYVNDLPPFKGPMMFLCGNQSKFVDPKSWPDIKKIFPNAEIHWLDAGHLVHFDQPAEFLKLVIDFLRN